MFWLWLDVISFCLWHVVKGIYKRHLGRMNKTSFRRRWTVPMATAFQLNKLECVTSQWWHQNLLNGGRRGKFPTTKVLATTTDCRKKNKVKNIFCGGGGWEFFRKYKRMCMAVCYSLLIGKPPVNDHLFCTKLAFWHLSNRVEMHCFSMLCYN